MVIIWLACAGFVLLLTPTGSLPSPRWRWWARVAAAAAVVWLLGSVVDPAPLRPEYPDIGNPLAVPALAGPLNALVAAAVVVLVALVVAAGSLLARFRRATGLERQQLRWLTFAAALASVAMLVALGDDAAGAGVAVAAAAVGEAPTSGRCPAGRRWSTVAL
jgi:hypothetical protein